MKKWRSRYPHPKYESVGVWENVVTGRCMMMRKIFHHFQTLPQAMNISLDDSQEAGGVDLSALQNSFSLEFIHLYLKMANSARIQSNYFVATKYLHLTETAILEVLKTDTVDYKNYLSVCLSACV